MGYSIRKTRDQKTVAALNQLLFPEDELDGPGNQHWLVRDDDGEAVGFCSARPSHSETDAVFLSRAGLLPAARRKGLHRRMIEVRERWARKQGFHRVITYVHATNVPSLRGLLSAGYAPYEPYWRDSLGDDFVIVEKRLDV